MQYWPLRVMSLVDHAAREHGDGEVVSAWADGSVTRTSWRAIAHDARRMAQALTALGLAKGDRVATLAMNHGRHLTAWYGAIGMGGVLHTINPRLFDEQLDYIVNHAGDRVLLYDAAFAPLVERMKPKWPGIEHYVCFDPPADWRGDQGFEQWLAPWDGEFAWVEGDETDPCGLCYTSGTTGRPKGVLFEHRSTLLHALTEVGPDIFNLSKRSVVLPIVPMFHANAWGVPWAAPLTGCKLVLSADYRPEKMCGLLNDEGVTHSAGVPTIWLTMIQHLEQSGHDLETLRHVTIGGTAAPRAMIQWFLERGIEVMHAWGMTETSPIGTVGARPLGWAAMSEHERIEFTARQGRVPFGVELRTVDEDGAVLPRDGKSSGALHVRGTWVLRRYFRAAEDCVDSDGWFDTGDIAALHPDGTMQITDRAKDVIKSGGEWISSVELENAAVGCPGIAQAAAIGIAHPKWDERPLLLCVCEAGSAVSAKDVLAHLDGRMARMSLPEAIEFVDALPHTGTGKVSKRALREQYRDYRFAGAEAMTGRD
ncbi:long-chain fatty acid--CoA ligase [Sphingomonas sp. ASV193]|uniref:long-chain fatty acid--CoA ligase n=1 Tax=Sphingomonas sp. ASV193 TaxID=3144405 RepID=UPI0032E89BB4